MEHDYFLMHLASERVREAHAEAAKGARAQAARAALGSCRRVHARSWTLLGRALIRVRDWLTGHAHPGLEETGLPGTETGSTRSQNGQG
jgi:hypothetical protein